MRRRESVAARFQVPAVKVAVPILIDGHKAALRIGETALDAEKAAELDLPGELYEPMGLEGVAQGEVRGAINECCPVVELLSPRDEISVAGEERAAGIRLASTAHVARFGVNGARIGHNRRYAAEAVRGESVSTADGSGTKIGVERVVVFRDVGIAAAQGETTAHALLERKDSAVVGAGIPRPEAVHLCGPAAAIIDARGKGKIRLSKAEDIPDVLVVVVHGDNPIVAELSLNAESVAASVGRGKARIDGYREIAGLENVERESPEGAPFPEIVGRTDCRVSGTEKCVRSEAGKLLDIADVDG